MIPTTDQIKNQLIPRLKKEFQKSSGDSSSDTSVSASSFIHIGNTPPEDTSKIWLDTSAYE